MKSANGAGRLAAKAGCTQRICGIIPNMVTLDLSISRSQPCCIGIIIAGKPNCSASGRLPNKLHVGIKLAATAWLHSNSNYIVCFRIENIRINKRVGSNLTGDSLTKVDLAAVFGPGSFIDSEVAVEAKGNDLRVLA